MGCLVYRGSFRLGKCVWPNEPATDASVPAHGHSECPQSLPRASERPDCTFTGKYKSEFARYVAHLKRNVGFCRGLLLEEIEKYVSDISEDLVLTCILIVPDVSQMSKGTRH